MKPGLLRIHELVGWGLDAEANRSLVDAEVIQSEARKASMFLHQRMPYQPNSPLLNHHQLRLRMLLSNRRESVARSGEFDELDWTLAVVDLAALLAFQRRLGFDEQRRTAIPHSEDIEALLDLTVPRVSLRPDYTSPYLEVALYRGRWFLRDGYHRSYGLLRRGINCVPAVVLHARTVEELGAIGHKFFSEDVLFSARPPMVCDFGNEQLTICYLRDESNLELNPASALSKSRGHEGREHGEANVDFLFGN